MTNYSVIRIPLTVQNCHALSGFYTDGPSFGALYGLVSRLEEDAKLIAEKLPILGFGLVLEDYKSRLGEHLVQGLDAVDKSNQTSMQPMGSYRYADMRLALYLKLPEIKTTKLDSVFSKLSAAANRARVQGGIISEFIGQGIWALTHSYMSAEAEQGARDLLQFIAKNEKSLSQVYAASHLPDELEGDDLIQAYAERLVEPDTVLVCNGYVVAGVVNSNAGERHHIAENNYTLAQIKEVFALKKPDARDNAVQQLKNFFWSFDAELNDKNPNYFVVT